jgi:predicted enzyme related to lactoylglutathione lyase
MGERTEYTPGTFSWTDLTTTDPEAAKTFYGGLFGWNVVDMPAGDGFVYSMAELSGKPVAAISAQPEQQRDAGAPPAWNSYITVESADETLARATQLGATVHAPAFDVLDVGRMGVVQDPQGAFFCVWEPKRHIGAGLVNAPGALSWNELATPDLDSSEKFYSGLFGWTATPFDGSPMPYRTIANSAGHGNGGMRNPGPGEPPYWLVYFGIDDIDSGLTSVERLGGSKMAGPIDLGPGKIGIVQDPQGAVFALYAGQYEP